MQYISRPTLENNNLSPFSLKLPSDGVDLIKGIFITMEKENEIWKDIPGYEGLYQVSNLGRVKSLFSGRWKIKDRILKNSNKGNGYKTNKLYKNGLKKTFATHQLVAMAFLNHTPNKYELIIDHINGNPSDNRLCNLHIVTPRENVTICFMPKRNTFTSKYPGVYWDKTKNKYAARINIKEKGIFIGRYNTEIEASNAYKEKLKEILQTTNN